MRSAAATNIVSLDEYRSRREERRTIHAPDDERQTRPAPTPTTAMWVYWVPVWVW
jgi:hypothetical protein